MKYFLSSFFFFLSFIYVIAQNKTDIKQYFEAYKESYGIFDIGLNTAKGQEMKFQVFEETETYIKFGIDALNLYIEMALFQGQGKIKDCVLMHKYYNQDFRTSIQKLQCMALNLSPLGNPLEPEEALSKDEMYAEYYQSIAFLHKGHFWGIDDKKDFNYQKIILPKNGKNTITLQYAKPKMQNGAIIEAMKFENGKALVQLEVTFETWGELSFQQEYGVFKFKSK